jgi:signal transduction histidine kinase
MTPVSTGVQIIADHLQDGATYSKEDALEACDSLQIASRFISQAVRAPLFSFAAMVEEVYEFAPTCLDAIVRDCVKLYQPTASNKMVTIEVEQSLAELPIVEVDAVKMRDAIGYVLDNAIKYSHKEKVVRIKGELSGNRARLAIEDFGQGIEEDELHLIFGRGYQGQRSRKALYEEGEGMGLFHARLIVEAHKGSIWAGCQSGGRSETSARLEGYRVWFNIELPIKQSDT